MEVELDEVTKLKSNLFNAISSNNFILVKSYLEKANVNLIDLKDNEQSSGKHMFIFQYNLYFSSNFLDFKF